MSREKSMHRRRRGLRREDNGIDQKEVAKLDNHDSSYRARAFFSRYSTLAYQAPPISVSKIPSAFIADIDKLKTVTARMMDRTCFTFAIGDISMVSPSYHRNKNPEERERTCDGHAKWTCLLVSRKANNIESKRDCSIETQSNSRPGRQLSGAPKPDMLQLPAHV